MTFQCQYYWDSALQTKRHTRSVVCKLAKGKINESRSGLEPFVKILNFVAI